VIDFNIALNLSHPDPKTLPPNPLKKFYGSWGYMSPEILLGFGKVLHLQSDVFSVGMILMEAFAGLRKHMMWRLEHATQETAIELMAMYMALLGPVPEYMWDESLR
jgi:serine/threonine protein kinase